MSAKGGWFTNRMREPQRPERAQRMLSEQERQQAADAAQQQRVDRLCEIVLAETLRNAPTTVPDDERALLADHVRWMVTQSTPMLVMDALLSLAERAALYEDWLHREVGE